MLGAIEHIEARIISFLGSSA